MNKKPGWVEFVGSFLQEYRETYNHLTDEIALETLDVFSVDQDTMTRFETLAHELRGQVHSKKMQSILVHVLSILLDLKST